MACSSVQLVLLRGGGGASEAPQSRIAAAPRGTRAPIEDRFRIAMVWTLGRASELIVWVLVVGMVVAALLMDGVVFVGVGKGGMMVGVATEECFTATYLSLLCVWVKFPERSQETGLPRTGWAGVSRMTGTGGGNQDQGAARGGAQGAPIPQTQGWIGGGGFRLVGKEMISDF